MSQSTPAEARAYLVEQQQAEADARRAALEQELAQKALVSPEELVTPDTHSPFSSMR